MGIRSGIVADTGDGGGGGGGEGGCVEREREMVSDIML